MRPCLLLMSGLAACNPWGPPRPPLDSGNPDPAEALVVSPAWLDWGALEVDGPGPWTRTFTITNAGTAPLLVHGHDEPVLLAGEPEAPFTVDADEPVFTLGAGEERELAVTFDPPGDGDWRAEIRVDYGVEVLSLRGSGTAPVLRLGEVDVPGTAVGCEAAVDLRVENTGRERLLIESVQVSEGEDFSLATDLDGAELVPGGGFDLALRFRPTWQEPAEGTRRAVLALRSNDPRLSTATVALEGFAYAGSPVVESFRYHPESTADLLFVADTDGVMSAHADKAQAAVPALLDALDLGNVDLHAAVVTGASACPTTTPAWVGGDDPRWRQRDVLEAGFEGPTGPGAAALLDHAVDALATDVPGGCLEGFRRPGAALHVITLAGGPDESGLDTSGHRAALAAAAPDAREVVASAVIATESAGCGGVAYGAGYAEAVLATGGEIVDLCQPDWSEGFQRIAARSHAGVDGELVHALAEVPLLDSLTVQIDGAAFSGWRFDTDRNAVVFPAETAPEPGSDVRIGYRIALSCD